MNGFLREQAKGFLFRINKSYESAVKESFLNTLAEDAFWYASKINGGKLRKECTLPDGTSVYIKFWKQKRPLHRVRTVWRPTKVEVEGHQYLQFTKNKLPVPDIILWGSHRIPFVKFGIFRVGMVVTRKIKGGENLSTLLNQKAPPWVIQNNWNHLEVLEKIAKLLHTIHKKNLIHGDYMLRNIVFTPGKSYGKYWVIDLSSGYTLSSSGTLLKSYHYNRDLFRMVYNLAKIGCSRNDILFFLKAYFGCEIDNNQSDTLAQQCLDASLSQNDHRAVEAKNRLCMSK